MQTSTIMADKTMELHGECTGTLVNSMTSG